MKHTKTKKYILAIAVTLLFSVALAFAALVAARGTAFAAEERVLTGKNFIYTVQLTGEGQSASIVFGKDGDSSFAVVADKAGSTLSLEKTYKEENAQKTDVLKSVGCDFGAEKINLTLVVNEGVAKVFTGSSAATLICKAEGYKGGTVQGDFGGFTASGVSFIKTDTPDGNIYVGGYTVQKVVNLSDGNYKLDQTEYTVKSGVVTVDGGYLNTLEAGRDYRFRVVTSFTDFDFTVYTDFMGVSATAAVERYYQGSDITLELSGDVTVNGLYVDGAEVEFTQTGDRVVISAADAAALGIGNHTVKLYTDKGRPETTINISEKVETVTEPAEKVKRVFLWIDLAIFGTAIIGYAAYSIISKRKSK